ncbi:MAG TPA: fibronectin type III domain-containing protein, partial [Allocoleopsis sp.]
KNKPLSESNIVAWQIVELPHPWKPFAKVYEKQGIRVSLTGDINLLKGDQIDQIVAKQGLANSNQEIPLTEGSFNIPVGYQYFLIDANWQNAANDVPITLTAPDGTVLTPDDLATGQSVAGKVARIVPEMVEATGKEVAIANPQAGTWQISIPDNLGVGNVKFTGWGKSASPTVKINSISIDRKQSNIAISYEATDSSPNAQVDLYYDPTGNGFDGYVIEEGLPLSGTYNWKVSGLPSDDYHVYAVVKDDENVSEASYYKDAVSWVQPKAPDQVQGVEAQWLGGNRIQVSWSPVRGASFYEITYTSDASGAEETDQTHVVSTKEDVPHIILPNLQRGQVYRFEVKAINKDETFSAPSTPVIAAVGNGSLAPLDAGEWQAAVVAGTNYRATVPIELDEILSLENAPVGATLDPNTGEFTWAVPADASGVYPIEILSINAFGEQQEITHNLFVSSQEITHYPSTINLDNFSDLSNLQINGSAEQSGSVLRLVSNRNNRSGNAFSETPFDITDKTSWQTHFKF